MRFCLNLTLCIAALSGTLTNAWGEEKAATTTLPAAAKELGIASSQIVPNEDAARVRGSGFFPDFLGDIENGFFPNFLTEFETGFRPNFLVEVDTGGFFPDFLQRIDGGGFRPDFLTPGEKGLFPNFLTDKVGVKNR
jgi:hypothetical protein